MSQQSSGGVSMIVVVMGAVLGVVLGLIVGAGGLVAMLKASPNTVSSLNLKAASKESKQATNCPACTCPECPKATTTSAYALVYPIEETLRIEGELDREYLRELVVKRRLKLQKCYQAELNKKPSTKGEVALQFTIGSTGSVVAAVARHNTTKNANIESCLLKEVKTWSFKDRLKTKMATVKVDVLFAPLGAGAP